ncbi:hypothetical protein [Anaeromassilibacillus sp. SJQ-1]|uniref:hypothetical protein n=1 Tax=Anaeromassilibacillus sp. SJQ-1 TaxID=3375419 RepID=UPI0039896920
MADVPAPSGPDKTRELCPHMPTRQLYAFFKEKQALKTTIESEPQFGLVLNWGFIIQGSHRPLVIELVNILVQPFGNISVFSKSRARRNSPCFNHLTLP